jgi:sulfatase modifying factor 1
MCSNRNVRIASPWVWTIALAIVASSELPVARVLAAEAVAKTTDKNAADSLNSKGKSVEATTNSIGMKLVLIPAGEFMAGAEEDLAVTLNQFPYCNAKWLADEFPRHPVRISKPFYMGQHEVTLGQFLKFYHAAGYKPDVERDGKPSLGYDKAKLVESNKFRPWAPGWEIEYDHPAVFISWNDAVAFCEWLSKTEGKTYRLPTEAEWEYACRAGSNNRYSFGDDPEDLVHFANGPDQDRKTVSPKAIIAASEDKSAKKAGIPFPYLSRRDGYAWTAPVGKLRPNAFGLYDMHGNVWEWCSDWYDAHYYEKAPSSDPQGPESGTTRVVRGGAFNFMPATMRCADRNSDLPGHRSCSYGFRVVCEQ